MCIADVRCLERSRCSSLSLGETHVPTVAATDCGSGTRHLNNSDLYPQGTLHRPDYLSMFPVQARLGGGNGRGVCAVPAWDTHTTCLMRCSSLGVQRASTALPAVSQAMDFSSVATRRDNNDGLATRSIGVPDMAKARCCRLFLQLFPAASFFCQAKTEYCGSETSEKTRDGASVSRLFERRGPHAACPGLQSLSSSMFRSHPVRMRKVSASTSTCICMCFC
ncbi:hypothetical protein HDV57DRAFT_196190 [Trichoderma longibrachiatum]